MERLQKELIDFENMRYTHDPRIGKCIEFLEFYSSIVIEKV